MGEKDVYRENFNKELENIRKTIRNEEFNSQIWKTEQWNSINQKRIKIMKAMQETTGITLSIPTLPYRNPRKRRVRRTLKMCYRTLWLKISKPEEGNITDIQALEIQRYQTRSAKKDPHIKTYHN